MAPGPYCTDATSCGAIVMSVTSKTTPLHKTNQPTKPMASKCLSSIRIGHKNKNEADTDDEGKTSESGMHACMRGCVHAGG